MITEVAAIILEQAGLGTPGQTLFIFHSPDGADNCLLLLEGMDGVERDENLPDYKKTEFKVIVRNTDYQSAMSIAKQVVAALDLHRLTVNGIYVNRMRATHDPIPFPIPDSDVIEVSVNIWAAFVDA